MSEAQIKFIMRVSRGEIETECVWRCPVTGGEIVRVKSITDMPLDGYCKWCETDHHAMVNNIHVEPVRINPPKLV